MTYLYSHFRVLMLAALLTGCLNAQSAGTSYFAGLGGSVTQGSGGTGLVTFGAQSGKTAVLFTIEVKAKTTTTEADAALQVASVGRFTLYALAGPGVQTGGSATLGAFTGGGLVTYNLRGATYLYAGVKVVTIGGIPRAEGFVGTGLTFK